MPVAAARSRTPRRLSPDEGFIALIIGAMEANDHTAPDEAARAQHILSSMARFRNRDGNYIGRIVEDMRRMTRDHAAGTMIDAACRAIPPRRRGAALAIVADVILVDGKMQRGERSFLSSVAEQLQQPPAAARAIVDVIRLRNQA